MKKLFWLACLWLPLVLASCSTPASKPSAVDTAGQIVPLVGTFKVHRYVLANGLKLLVVEDHSSPTLAYNTWYSVGSRNEVPTRTGLAHLFEHLMFKGTTNYKEGELDRILETAGAEGENAFTSKDFTAYVQELPKDKLDLIARMESDRMVNLIVDDNSFKTEREVVQNERRFRTENNPDGTLYQSVYELAYKRHPYRWPVIGYSEDLENMTSQDARQFYRHYYSPNHATVVVVGDVDASQVYAVVQKYYGSFPAQPDVVRAIPQEEPQIAPIRKVIPLNIQVEKILLAYHVPGVLDPDYPALATLQSVLTGGKSSRLYRALVDSGIASSVDSYDVDEKDPSLFILVANLQKGKRAALAETVMLREIKQLAKNPPSESELERAKNKISFSFYESLGSNGEKAGFLGHFEAIAGDFEKGLEQYAKISAVTVSDVQNVAKKYLNPNGRTVVTGVNHGN